MTRQELYDKIKKSSKDAFIYEDMVKSGFWEGEKPQLPKDLSEKEIEIKRELKSLSMKIKEPKNALKEIHKKRMEEALKRREETRQKRVERDKKRKREREIKKREEIGFIGYSYIKALQKDDNIDIERLHSHNLPKIRDVKELSEKVGIDIGELRFLTYTQKVSPRTHYIKFKITKKIGGYREISAPMPKLKALQHWILEKILYKVAPHESANGFIRGKNIVSNASFHLNKSVVINIDLKNFFPTITFARVRGLFENFGYSTQISTIFAILLTEPVQEKVVVDGKEYFIYLGERTLPQGSPASPMVSNLICRKLDNRLSGLAKSLGFVYSRYADDLSFSAESYKNISKILFWIDIVVQEEGFTVHKEKTQVMRKGSSQKVTGIVVNEKLSIPRKDLRRFRALLHQIEKSGLEGKSWQGKSKNLMATLWGYANFINMVDSKKGEIYLDRVKRVLEKYPMRSESEERGENQKISENMLDEVLNIFKRGEER
jgi:retron-type reverse transcriptase